jgi:hypothetical protein
LLPPPPARRPARSTGLPVPAARLAGPGDGVELANRGCDRSGAVDRPDCGGPGLSVLAWLLGGAREPLDMRPVRPPAVARRTCATNDEDPARFAACVNSSSRNAGSGCLSRTGTPPESKNPMPLPSTFRRLCASSESGASSSQNVARTRTVPAVKPEQATHGAFLCLSHLPRAPPPVSSAAPVLPANRAAFSYGDGLRPVWLAAKLRGWSCGVERAVPAFYAVADSWRRVPLRGR